MVTCETCNASPCVCAPGSLATCDDPECGFEWVVDEAHPAHTCPVCGVLILALAEEREFQTALELEAEE